MQLPHLFNWVSRRRALPRTLDSYPAPLVTLVLLAQFIPISSFAMPRYNSHLREQIQEEMEYFPEDGGDRRVVETDPSDVVPPSDDEDEEVDYRYFDFPNVVNWAHRRDIEWWQRINGGPTVLDK